MTLKQSAEFDVKALYAALDAQRQSRRMSPSTLNGMRKRRVIEGDGVLQALRWLHRTAESFIPGHQKAATEEATWPHVDPHQSLRFDAREMYTALDAQRIERSMTWKQVANEIGGVSPPRLTRLARGGRVAFPEVMRIVRWLGRPAASFTRISDR